MAHPTPFTIQQVKNDLSTMTATGSKLTYWLWNDHTSVEVRTSTDVYGFPSVALLHTSPARGLDVKGFNSLDYELDDTDEVWDHITDPYYDALFNWITQRLNQMITASVPKGHPMYPHTSYSTIVTKFN